MRCCFSNCRNNRSDPTISWRRIPGPVKQPPTTKKLYNRQLEMIATKRHLRNECLRRIGVSINDTRPELRICNEHSFEKVQVSVNWTNMKGENIITKTEMYLPTIMGVRQTMSTSTSKGTAINRNIRRQLSIVESQATTGDTDAAYR